MPRPEKHIIVVGAGIIGASIAWHLVRANMRVTVVDAGMPGGVASPCSFGWINASYGNPRPYFDLRCRSMREWDRMASEIDRLPYRKTGTLYTDFERIDLDTFAAQHTGWGYDLRWITRDEARRLEPNLTSIPERVLLAQDEGVAEAQETARFLIELCRDQGAEIVPNTRINALQVSGSRVTGVVTGNDGIGADEIVVAAGAETPEIAATAGIHIPLRTPPGLLIQTEPHARIVHRTVLAADLHVRQRNDGVVVAGADFGGGAINDDPEAGGAKLLARLGDMFEGAKGLKVARATTGFRPTPEDGFPIIGRPPNIDGLYLAVMHSGVTLAPAAGLFAAQEIIEGVRDPLLSPFGVDRFV